MRTGLLMGLVIVLAAGLMGCGTTSFGPVTVGEYYTVPAGQDMGMKASESSPAVAAKVEIDKSVIEDVPESVRGMLPDDVSVWLVFGAERTTPSLTNASVKVEK